MDNLIKTRQYLKQRLQKDAVTFYGFTKERANIKDLFLRTAKEGESNSTLLIGQKYGGKTTLINSVLYELLHDEDFVTNTIVIALNGLIHVDDRQALKAVTTQMNLEKQVEGKTFSSFSENLTFLLSCLKAGRSSQRLIFIIDEFDLFCAHHKQTLLYNLFDVAQSAQTPICVLGVTCRLDYVELLEKRVKSRFSHRQIFLFPDSNNFKDYLQNFAELLTLPTTADVLSEYSANNPPLSKKVFQEFKLPFLRKVFDPTAFALPNKYVKEWNQKVRQLVENENVEKSLEMYFESNVTIASMKFLLFQIVAKLNEDHKFIIADDVIGLTERLTRDDDKVKLMTGLSVLEVCLLVAIKHHCDIYDNDPFNFEMIFGRFNKFAIKSSTMQNIEREMVLKRFENLRHQEYIVPIGVDGKVQKEYQMYKMLIFADQIDKAILKYLNLPTEIEQWAKSSII